MNTLDKQLYCVIEWAHNQLKAIYSEILYNSPNRSYKIKGTNMNPTLLPINTKRETRLAFHLSMILQHHIYPWFYEKYINLIIHGDREIVIDFIDNKVDASYREYMDERITYAHGDIKTDINVNKLRNYVTEQRPKC